MAFRAGTMGTASGGRGSLPAVEVRRLRPPLVQGVQIPDAAGPSWGACQEQHCPQRGPKTGTTVEEDPKEVGRATGRGQSTGGGGRDQ